MPKSKKKLTLVRSTLVGKKSIDAKRKPLKNAVFPLHNHEHFEIEFVLSGHGTGTINGRQYELSAGSIYLLTPADLHDLITDGEMELVCIAFDQGAIHSDVIEKLFNVKDNIFFQLSRKEYVQFFSLIILLVSECKSEESDMRLLSDLLESVLILLIRKTAAMQGEMTHMTYAGRAVAYLESHFRESPSLDYIAEYVGLNKNYFCKLFRAETGKTLVQYVRDLKLNYGRRVLMTTDLTVHEISQKCGFNSFSAFIREFKKKYNETPLQCRKNAGAENLKGRGEE